MRFFHLALLAPQVLGFTIPEGQPDGVYQVTYDNGQEIHTLIGTADSTVQAPPSSSLTGRSAKFLRKRDDYTCGGDALNNLDTDRANAQLDQQCGNGAWVGGEQDFYSIASCTVAYFCNFQWNSNQCFASARQQASAAITAQCGLYRSGWENFQTSYGYEDFCKAPGNNFCGRGRG